MRTLAKLESKKYSKISIYKMDLEDWCKKDIEAQIYLPRVWVNTIA